VHSSGASTHRGTDQTLVQLQRRFYWPGMRRDVEKHIDQCAVCKESKASTHKHWGDLRPHMPPTKPFTHYAMDFMFGFPASSRQTTLQFGQRSTAGRASRWGGIPRRRGGAGPKKQRRVSGGATTTALGRGRSYRPGTIRQTGLSRWRGRGGRAVQLRRAAVLSKQALGRNIDEGEASTAAGGSSRPAGQRRGDAGRGSGASAAADSEAAAPLRQCATIDKKRRSRTGAGKPDVGSGPTILLSGFLGSGPTILLSGFLGSGPTILLSGILGSGPTISLSGFLVQLRCRRCTVSEVL